MHDNQEAESDCDGDAVHSRAVSRMVRVSHEAIRRTVAVFSRQAKNNCRGLNVMGQEGASALGTGSLLIQVLDRYPDLLYNSIAHY